MNRKLIRLTESDLHRIAKESVAKVRRLYESDESEMGTDEEFDAFMRWATTKGSDMFSSAANEYVNNGDESKLYVLSTYYAKEVGLNQNVAFNIAKEAAEGIYGFLGGMQVVDTRNANESINTKMNTINEWSPYPKNKDWRKIAEKRPKIVPNPSPYVDDKRGWGRKVYKTVDGDWYEGRKYLSNIIDESLIRRAIAESINKVINESLKGTDPENVVPEDLARKYDFKSEYVDSANGLELWGKDILNDNPNRLLFKLGIHNFTSVSKTATCMHVRITVKPSPRKSLYSKNPMQTPRKIGDYVNSDYGDDKGVIFNNPKNGHTRRLDNFGRFK